MEDMKSRVHNGLDLAASLIELNLLFILTSIPIVTIGASATALETTIQLSMEDRVISTHKTYFKKFKENIKQSTILWLIGILLYVVFALDIYGTTTVITGTAGTVLRVIAVLGIILTTFVLIYGLAMIGRFYNPLGKLIYNSLYLSLRYAPRSIVMTIFTLSPLLAVWWAPDYLGIELMLFIILWVSAIGYVNAILLKDVFKPFLPEEEEVREDELDELNL